MQAEVVGEVGHGHSCVGPAVPPSLNPASVCGRSNWLNRFHRPATIFLLPWFTHQDTTFRSSYETSNSDVVYFFYTSASLHEWNLVEMFRLWLNIDNIDNSAIRFWNTQLTPTLHFCCKTTWIAAYLGTYASAWEGIQGINEWLPRYVWILSLTILSIFKTCSVLLARWLRSQKCPIWEYTPKEQEKKKKTPCNFQRLFSFRASRPN